MAKPDIKLTTSGYEFYWIDGQITIEISRIHTHMDGKITGEIFIRNGTKALRPPSQINFTADRTRDTLVKSLSTTYPDKAEWRRIIDELCYHVLDLTRKGEPIIEAWSGEDVEPPQYILYPFIIKNYPSIIFGDPGTIKSTMALLFSQIMMLPWKDNPLEIPCPDRPLKVLYLDWETDLATIKWQLTKLERGRGMGLNACMVYYRLCSLPLANDIEELRKRIAELNVDVIIIDSLGLATGGELKEAGPAISFFSALRQLVTTSLILAHSPKDSENVKNKSIYGTVFFQAQARNIWEIKKSQEPGSSKADIALYHKKPAPFQSYHSPIGFSLEYTDDSIVICKNDPTTVPDLLERMGVQVQITKYMEGKSGTVSPSDIAENVGMPLKNVNKALNDMKAKGRAVNVSWGQWGLPL